jgi:uncharacterized protein YukE
MKRKSEDSADEQSAALRSVANAITPRDAGAGRDAAGGTVDSLTEAVMGVTAGLCRIADAIEHLAEALRERDDKCDDK